jgi:hypothetical protein
MPDPHALIRAFHDEMEALARAEALDRGSEPSMRQD